MQQQIAKALESMRIKPSELHCS